MCVCLLKSQRFLELNFVGRPAHPDDCRATGLEAHDEESPQSTTTELRLLQQGFTALMVSKGLLYWSRHEMNPNHHSKGLKKWSVLMDLAMLNLYIVSEVFLEISLTHGTNDASIFQRSECLMIFGTHHCLAQTHILLTFTGGANGGGVECATVSMTIMYTNTYPLYTRASQILWLPL